MIETDIRCFLYHATHGPRIFETPAEIEAALADGWVDDPAKALAVSQPAPKAAADLVVEARKGKGKKKAMITDSAQLVRATLAAAGAMMIPPVVGRVRDCPYGDPACPCQDGDPCHYEGKDRMPAPKPLPTELET